MVNQIVNVAKKTELKNKIIKSPRVAVIDIKKDQSDAPKTPGIVSFTLPKGSRDSKDLQDCEVGSSDVEADKENTILLVSRI